jgi:hypothetical protein
MVWLAVVSELKAMWSTHNLQLELMEEVLQWAR